MLNRMKIQREEVTLLHAYTYTVGYTTVHTYVYIHTYH